MMKKIKRIIVVCSAAAANHLFICIAILAVISAGIGVTIAYLGHSQQAENNVVIGHDDADITEEFLPPSEQSMVSENQKDVTFQNTGTVPCFVRVYVEFSDRDIADRASVKLGDTYYLWNDFKNDMVYSRYSSDWRFIPENGTKLGGYFYYTKMLQPGESTSSVFTDVKVDFRIDDQGNTDPNESNTDLIRDYDMIVYTETVQTVETGSKEVGGEVVHGYEYKSYEWREAWESFLKMS